MSEKIQKLLERAAQQTASSSDGASSVSHAECNFSSAPEAEKSFAQLSAKLFQINRWNAHSALMSFAPFDEKGGECKRESANVGDFIRLTLIASGKDDWVKIIRIEDAPDEVILTVQPSYNPTEKNADASVTSHFFTSESTNNFCLEKSGTTINFYVVGLNEKTNTADTKNILETVRNAATANVGHYLGIQKMEWTQFCENFLKSEELKNKDEK